MIHLPTDPNVRSLYVAVAILLSPILLELVPTVLSTLAWMFE
jgi:hypothetical protein